MKKLFFLLYILFFVNISAQLPMEVTVSVDSTEIKLGQKIEYNIQIKSDSLIEILFNEKLTFYPFEILEQTNLETIRNNSNYLYTKKYSLIHFDSGNHWIPQQKINVNGFSAITDSILVSLAHVEVDTLKQPLYDIKAIIAVKKNYNSFINLGLFFSCSIILAWLIFRYLEKKKLKTDETILPFERAIQDLKRLENIQLSDHQEYKQYYSRLTDIIRRYLEEEANVSALESTSDELLMKLELLKDSGKMELEMETLNNLKKVLKHADLAKFALSSPDIFIAKEDRVLVKEVVVKTKEAIPEPTKEEIEASEAYQRKLIIKRRKNLIKIGLLGLISLIIIGIGTSMIIHGYFPVRDEIFQYPTKKLLSGKWIKSQYGTPPLEVETPEVLVRIPLENDSIKLFNYKGDWGSPFLIELKFGPPIFFNSEDEISDEEKDLLSQNIFEKLIQGLEKDGAINILPKNKVLKTKGGIEAIHLFGSLDIMDNTKEKNSRCNFLTIAFILNQRFIELKMIYEKEDRYGKEIEQRILNSIEIIKEL